MIAIAVATAVATAITVATSGSSVRGSSGWFSHRSFFLHPKELIFFIISKKGTADGTHTPSTTTTTPTTAATAATADAIAGAAWTD